MIDVTDLGAKPSHFARPRSCDSAIMRGLALGETLYFPATERQKGFHFNEIPLTQDRHFVCDPNAKLISRSTFFVAQDNAWRCSIKGGRWFFAEKFLRSTKTVSDCLFQDLDISGVTDAVFDCHALVSNQFVRVKGTGCPGVGWKLGPHQSNNNYFECVKWSQNEGALIKSFSGIHNTNTFVQLLAEHNTCPALFELQADRIENWIVSGYFENSAAEFVFKAHGWVKVKVRDCTFGRHDGDKLAHGVGPHVDIWFDDKTNYYAF